MSNYYTKAEVDSKITNGNSIFISSNSKVGDCGIITDGVYNVRWVIYTISGNTYQLFPMENLTCHVMHSDYRTGEYTKSEMYPFIHNTVLPNLRRSGLNITACDLVSKSVYDDICSKTGIASRIISGGEYFWLTDYNESWTYTVYYDGKINDYELTLSRGVRPLITVVK